MNPRRGSPDGTSSLTTNFEKLVRTAHLHSTTKKATTAKRKAGGTSSLGEYCRTKESGNNELNAIQQKSMPIG